MYKQNFEKKAIQSMEALERKLAKLHATGAHPNMLNIIMVEYYGDMTPIGNMATINAPDALTLMVKPFDMDKKVVKTIAEAINGANIGVSAVDMGDHIRVSVPPIDGEKRRLYTKEAKQIAEEAKVSLRSIRQEVLKKIKNDKDLNEDFRKQYETEVEESMKDFQSKIENHYSIKEKELLTV